MTAADLATVLLTLATMAGVIVLIVAVSALLRDLRELRVTLERVRDEALPMVEDLRDAVRDAGAEVERVDELLDTAASIQRTVDNASRLTYVAFSHPLIKVVSFFRGLGRGVKSAFSFGSRRRRKAERRRAERATRKAA